MKRIIFLLLAAMTAPALAYPQNEDDALRYSYLTFGGTARYNGIAGAFGALGADFSTLSTNPAGIGLYKSSEFTFTPSLFVGKTESSYLGNTYNDMRYNFNLGNLGMVLAFPTNSRLNNSGWKNIQFGLGINRSSNYNNRMVIEGTNNVSSLLDQWALDANGTAYDQLNPFDLNLAFNTWLLDTVAGNPGLYKNATPAGGILQRKSVNSWGSMNEWVLSMGANYNDRFYIGGTLGFPFLKYNEESTHSELAVAEEIGFEHFREFTYHQNLETEGSGFNFKFGMIFKPVDFVRIGAAIHTPTYFYNMHENYSSSVKSRFDNGDNYEETSPEGSYDYRLNTPMRAIGSLAFIIGTYGLVSADYEFVDYSESRFRSNEEDVYFDVNDAIRNKYTTAGNLRVGTEWRFNEFSFRGGYALYDSPFKSGLNDFERTSFTLGLGLRQQDYFLDFAYVNTTSNEDYYLYDPGKVPVAKTTNTVTTQAFLMTMGFRF